MNPLLINKISKLVKTSINEAFDFNNELESNDSGINVISHDMMEGFNSVVSYTNLLIPVNELFYGLFKCKNPFGLSKKYIEVDGIGPILYNPKKYKDVNNLYLFSTPGYNENLYMNNIYKNYESMEKAGWKFYKSEPTRVEYSFPRENSMEHIPARILAQLNILAKRVDIQNDIKNFAKKDFKDHVAFAISPDNGIVVIDILASQAAEESFGYSPYAYKIAYPIYTNMVFFTGIQEYVRNNKEATKNKKEIKAAEMLERIQNTIHGALQADNMKHAADDNRICYWVLDENDHYVLPLGSNLYPYGCRGYNAKLPTNTTPPTVTAFDDKSIYRLTKQIKYLPLKYYFTYFTKKQNWEPVYANSKLLIFEHIDYKFCKIFITPSLDVIEKFFGPKIKNLCKDRPTILEHIIGTEDMTTYGVFWFSDSINDFLDKMLKKEIKMKDLDKAVSQHTLNDLIN